jgi:2Fe-2S ferredoxin
MLGLKGNGYDVLATCGGILSCATCHVYVSPEDFDRLQPPTDLEIELLEEGSFFRPGSSRLSCQIKVGEAIEGLAVAIAPED